MVYKIGQWAKFHDLPDSKLIDAFPFYKRDMQNFKRQESFLERNSTVRFKNEVLWFQNDTADGIFQLRGPDD